MIKCYFQLFIESGEMVITNGTFLIKISNDVELNDFYKMICLLEKITNSSSTILLSMFSYSRVIYAFDYLVPHYGPV